MRSRYDFTGKALLMTGANGGIGRAIARMFFEAGAQLCLTDLADEALAEFARSLDPARQRIATLRGEAARSADSEAAVAICRERFGGIDFLVTAAGRFPRKPIEEMSDDDWHETLGVNLDGVFFISRASIPALRDNSAIVHIASLAGHIGSPEYIHYGTAKGGVIALARSLARGLAPRTRVNAVSPGIIDTAMVQPMLATEGNVWIDETPLKRMGRPEEVASAVAFLCSEDASFITGETLQVNGGLYVR